VIATGALFEGPAVEATGDQQPDTEIEWTAKRRACGLRR
jgi:hypothetical protein